MVACACKDVHERKRVVLTGGPGAGKTALLELVRQSFCTHVKVLPEAASIVFGGGFPRDIHGGSWLNRQPTFSTQRRAHSRFCAWSCLSVAGVMSSRLCMSTALA